MKMDISYQYRKRSSILPALQDIENGVPENELTPVEGDIDTYKSTKSNEGKIMLKSVNDKFDNILKCHYRIRCT